MKDLTKYFIDLSKLSEERVKEIRLLIFGSGEQSTHLVSGYTDGIVRTKLHYHESKIWTVAASDCNLEKTELLYPEFIKLFDGGEGENNGWIKIGEDGKINYNGLMWGVDKSGFVHYFSEGDFIEIGYLTHYQPIKKPLPPKS